MCEKIAYNHGKTTPDLGVFISNYQRALAREMDTRALPDRVLYNQKKSELGEKGLLAVIEAKMGQSDFVLLENDFPYTNLIPIGSSLKQYCLWSKDEDKLTTDAINMLVEDRFPNRPAFIFRHCGDLISIRKIPHAHIIVDFKS